MTPELLAPPLVRCARCQQLDDLSQMQGIGREAVCGPCWLAEARKQHERMNQAEYIRIEITEA
jgi:recombinational DNA repair protein (RecF pathway)